MSVILQRQLFHPLSPEDYRAEEGGGRRVSWVITDILSLIESDSDREASDKSVLSFSLCFSITGSFFRTSWRLHVLSVSFSSITRFLYLSLLNLCKCMKKFAPFIRIGIASSISSNADVPVYPCLLSRLFSVMHSLVRDHPSSCSLSLSLSLCTLCSLPYTTVFSISARGVVCGQSREWPVVTLVRVEKRANGDPRGCDPVRVSAYLKDHHRSQTYLFHFLPSNLLFLRSFPPLTHIFPNIEREACQRSIDETQNAMMTTEMRRKSTNRMWVFYQYLIFFI